MIFTVHIDCTVENHSVISAAATLHGTHRLNGTFARGEDLADSLRELAQTIEDAERRYEGIPD